MSERQNGTLQKQSPQETSHRLTRIILEDFKKITRRSDDPAKSFICHYDLKKIWKDKGRIKTLLYPDDVPPAVLDVIQKNMFTILSVLVSIGAENCLAEFRKRLFKPNGRDPRFTDQDIPLERGQIEFLAAEPALEEQFSEQQHKFSPVVISLEEFKATKEFDPLRRLPFEVISEDLGIGAFSDVKLVRIPSKYFKEVGGSYYDDVYKVACKKIHVDKNFNQEVDNLQILKESLTSQDHILKHLATIKHGLDRYILLPHASLGDLYQFLHCGKDLDDNENLKYDFRQRFQQIPDPGSGDVSPALLKQCRALAGALKWLHSGIDVESSDNSNTIFCAHMDLKPDNILIQPDADSIVGKWMISDFGISVIQENKRTNNSNIVSVRDWYERHTLNTRPKRNTGTYQAPEVKLSEQLRESPERLAADQKGVGRKSDIWSYGCIFSEVLAWALGRDEQVEIFNLERRKGGNNYFFDSKYLGSPSSLDQFEVRQSVVDWLNLVQDGSRSPCKWARCWAGTIKDILVVDTGARPDADRLVELVEHVKVHQKHSLDKKPIECSYLRSTSGRRRPVDRTKQDDEAPTIVVYPEPEPQREPVSVPDPAPKDESKSELEPHGPSPPAYMQPAHAHGISINPDTPIPRSAQEPICWQGVRGDVLDVALSHTEAGTAVAFLMKEVVQIYNINLQHPPATSHRKLELTGIKWKDANHAHVAFAGGILAVWGHCTQQNKKLLCLYDVDKPERFGSPISSPISEGIDMLKTVAISPQGVVALVRREDILIKLVKPPSPPRQELSYWHGLNHSSSGDIRLYPRPKQKYAHAAFNDVGNLLFAWAYDKTESLYVWRVQNGVLETVTDSESHYPSEERGIPSTKVIPYNTYHGCIIATPEKRFFPAQTRSSLIDGTQLLNRHDIQLEDFKTGCVFQDHSFVAVEKRSGLPLWHCESFYLKEYEIKYGAVHFLQHQGQQLCKLTSKVRSSSKLRVLKSGTDLVAVVCNRDGTIELVRFT